MKFYSDKNEEIAMIYNVINHPAGYVLDLLEDLLQIRPIYTSSGLGWEVSWKEVIDDCAVDAFKKFSDPLEAATFYVEKRHEIQVMMY